VFVYASRVNMSVHVNSGILCSYISSLRMLFDIICKRWQRSEADVWAVLSSVKEGSHLCCRHCAHQSDAEHDKSVQCRTCCQVSLVFLWAFCCLLHSQSYCVPVINYCDIEAYSSLWSFVIWNVGNKLCLPFSALSYISWCIHSIKCKIPTWWWCLIIAALLLVWRL